MVVGYRALTILRVKLMNGRSSVNARSTHEGFNNKWIEIQGYINILYVRQHYHDGGASSRKKVQYYTTIHNSFLMEEPCSA